MSDERTGEASQGSDAPLEVEVNPMDTIMTIFQRARRLALRENRVVYFIHNYRTCYLAPDFAAEDLIKLSEIFEQLQEGGIISVEQARSIVTRHSQLS